MINPRCGEVWENRRVFQGAVGNATRFPWPRRLSAAVGSEPELRPPFVSKSLTRSVADDNYKQGVKAKSYIAADPEMFALAIEEASKKMPVDSRTVEDVDKAWKRMTGSSLEETEVHGRSNRVLYALTNYCPSLEVFIEAAMLVPGVSSDESRVSRLEYQWRAHLRKDAERTAPAVAEEEIVMVRNRG